MMVFKSKIGTELIVPLALILSGCGILMITTKAWLGLFFILLVAAAISWVFLSIEYRIDQNKLMIFCAGILYKSIDIHSIKEIKNTRDPISSPAGSLDRIAILYGGSKRILLSPKNKAEFIQNLLEIHSDIKTESAKIIK
jgi:hypothetical protein